MMLVVKYGSSYLGMNQESLAGKRRECQWLIFSLFLEIIFPVELILENKSLVMNS